jgi:CARDB
MNTKNLATLITRPIKLMTYSLALGTLAALSLTSGGSAAPSPLIGCPDGWVPRPPELNPALGACMPGEFVADQPVLPLLKPDLKVKQYLFASAKVVRVQVANYGNANAGSSILRLTVCRINGIPVARKIEVQVSPVPKQQTRRVSIDTQSILPDAVALKDTTFRLDVDVTQMVGESNETNNTIWHNL